MRDGFVKVAAATPRVKVGDTEHNGKEIIKLTKRAAEAGAKVIVFPELCITAYTCGDLFLQDRLIKSACETVFEIAEATKDSDILIAAGVPIGLGGCLYNCASVIKGGEVLGFVTKSHIPNYSEFYEARHFVPLGENTEIVLKGKKYPMGPKLLFEAENMPDFVVGAEICEDLWVPNPPSGAHAENGATVILNLSAGDEVIGKAEYRRCLVASQSGRSVCAYVYADAGYGESSTDMVFSGHNIICENGTFLSQSRLFENGIIFGDVDVNRLVLERRKISTFKNEFDKDYKKISFPTKIEETKLERTFDPHPFVPKEEDKLRERCELIFTMQAEGLEKRLEHIGATSVTVGVSGGLDSTLALLVSVRAFEKAGLDKKGINALTMPCFGTTGRTNGNAKSLAKAVGANLVEIPISEDVTVHLRSIGADINNHNTTYENSQARERTRVLMDYAGETGGIVVGTGDLSEMALGWTTYNGDHMSMYNVNCSIPKTLVRYLVAYVAEISGGALRDILLDILDTPVSPELLPPKDGVISQVTEDLVGPYELHDFFLYYFLRFGFEKAKIYRMAKIAFGDKYDSRTIAKWLDVFYDRFRKNQFKRSCMPDGPKVGSVTLSPRGDWRMPSDAEKI